jgi:hypothetical protein
MTDHLVRHRPDRQPARDFQDVLGEGPCRDAYRDGEPVVTTLDDRPGSAAEFPGAWQTLVR